MNLLLCLVALALTLTACKKGAADPISQEDIKPEVFSSATYQITVTGRWNSTDFVLPPNVHFTRIAGAVHNKNISLWKEGALASASLEAIAEIGNAGLMWAEVDTLIRNGKALEKIVASTPPPTGTSVFKINPNTDFPLISFASMLAPTPDWFFGVTSFSLYRNETWIKDTTLYLYGYDGGTEEGDGFGYNNPETLPQQPIQLLTKSNASVLFKNSVLPIAEVRMHRQ